MTRAAKVAAVVSLTGADAGEWTDAKLDAYVDGATDAPAKRPADSDKPPALAPPARGRCGLWG